MAFFKPVSPIKQKYQSVVTDVIMIKNVVLLTYVFTVTNTVILSSDAEVMRMIDNEDIIISLIARLHPTSNAVPECDCRVALTGCCLYVSEDNYEGTYTDHYVLDLGLIQELKLSSPYANSLGPNHDFKFGLLCMCGGPFKGGLVQKLLGSKTDNSAKTSRKKGNPEAKFLEIVYSDDKTGRTEHLFLSDPDIPFKLLIMKFKELTGRS